MEAVFKRAFGNPRLAVVVCAGLLATTPAAASEAFFMGLGDLPGGKFNSVVSAYGDAVSDDGSVVVGSSAGVLSREAFRWTLGGGMVGIGNFSSGGTNEAKGASADGSVVVGSGVKL